MPENKIITVFTPTFNRIHTLPKLYESLINQKNKNFVWLIVDDGSSDGTENLINNWKKENKIDILYYYQQNSGKMQAHNFAVEKCITELFVCCDSDDFLADNAIQMVLDDYKIWKLDLHTCGAIAYKGKSASEILSTKFIDKRANSTLNGLYREGFSGDTTLVYKTSILKQFLFPKIKNEKFITEDYIYCQIDELYQMHILPKIIIICEYLSDGYTKSAIKLLFNNPIGMSLYYNLKIKLSKTLKERCQFVIRYYSINRIGKNINAYINCNSKLLYILMSPIAYIYYLRKRKLYNKFLTNKHK